MRAKAIKIEEHKGVGAGKYLLVDIQGGGSIEFTDGSDRLPYVTSDQAYSRWTLEASAVDGKIYAIRENVAGPKAKEDVKAAGGDEVNAEVIVNNNEVISAIGKIAPEDEISKVRGNAIERTATTIEGQAANEQINVTQTVNNAVRTRINDIAFSSTKRNMAALAAGDAENEAVYGAWAMPFYSVASQKKQKQGMIAGYDAKTSGGIFGVDTMLNDNLSLGTAVSITNTNMKYNGNKTGDKSQIKGLIFSVYGSQQFADNYFVQAIASLSSNNVNNHEKQIRGDTNNSVVTEIAQGKYRSKSFSGEVLFGYNADLTDLVLVPSIGVRYTKNNGVNYKETGTKLQNRTISRKASDKVEGVIGTNILVSPITVNNIAVQLGGHVFVDQKIGGKVSKVQVKLDGQNTPFIARKDKSANTMCNIGVNITAKQNTMLEYGIGYDAYLASKYIAHQGTLKVRVNF